MSNEINVGTATGNTIYVLLFNAAGKVWNTATLAFETYVTASRASYDIALTELGTAAGIYLGDFPSSISSSGTYPYYGYVQAGGSPAEGDTLIQAGEVDWTGTSAVTSDASNAMSASDWRDYVLRGGFKRTDKDTEIYEATTDAIQEMRRRFGFDEAQEDKTTTESLTVDGDFKISVESDLGLVMGVVLQDGTDAQPLNIISKHQFDKLYPDINVTGDRGYPKDVTFYNGSMCVGHIPDQLTYTFRISYSQRAGTISSTTTAVPFTNVYRDALRDLVNHYLYEALDDFDKANYFRNKFEGKFIDMTRRETINQASHVFAGRYQDF